MNEFKTIDRILRGDAACLEEIKQGSVGSQAGAMVRVGLLLGALYGVCMGLFASLRPEGPGVAQLFASAVKVPLLFLLTLLVTFPSLYVSSALSKSQLRFLPTLRLLLAASTVNLVLLASLGPVTAFFTLSSDSYPFMVLLNVVFFGIAGLVGLGYLRRSLTQVFLPPERKRQPLIPPIPTSNPSPSDSPENAAVPEPPALREIPVFARPHEVDAATRIFTIWMFVFGVVGCQMGWILRPFIGSPDRPFEWFRPRSSHFLEALGDALRLVF